MKMEHSETNLVYVIHMPYRQTNLGLVHGVGQEISLQGTNQVNEKIYTECASLSELSQHHVNNSITCSYSIHECLSYTA